MATTNVMNEIIWISKNVTVKRTVDDIVVNEKLILVDKVRIQSNPHTKLIYTL